MRVLLSFQENCKVRAHTCSQGKSSRQTCSYLQREKGPTSTTPPPSIDILYTENYKAFKEIKGDLWIGKSVRVYRIVDTLANGWQWPSAIYLREEFLCHVKILYHLANLISRSMVFDVLFVADGDRKIAWQSSFIKTQTMPKYISVCVYTDIEYIRIYKNIIVVQFPWYMNTFWWYSDNNESDHFYISQLMVLCQV